MTETITRTQTAGFREPGPLVESSQISVEPPLTITTHRTSSRDCGRRAIVRNAAGQVVYDSDDCYDMANALNGVDLWLADRIAAGEYRATQA